jgi:hypothetical protein
VKFQLDRPMLNRRQLIRAGGAFAFTLPAALAKSATPLVPPSSAIQQSVVTPEIHISYGQSWRSNVFDLFGLENGRNPCDCGHVRMNFDFDNLLALHTTNMGGDLDRPGPLSNSAGIWLSGPIDGITTYSVDSNYQLMEFSIGRCAVLAQQSLQARNRTSAVSPIVEFCCAYPGQAWTSGSAGGLQPGSVSWSNQKTIIAQIRALPIPLPFFGRPNRIFDAPVYRSVGYTQGGSSPNTVTAKLADLAAMLNEYDALGLPGTHTHPLNYYMGIPAATSDSKQLQQSLYGTALFCRINAPNQGGTWSSRCFATSPWYQWPFDGISNIHVNDYGTVRVGEMEGYIRHLVQDLDIAWTPLWQSLKTPITVSGQTIIVPFDRPAGPDFSQSSLSFIADRYDGIKERPQKGFCVKRAGVDLTVTPQIRDLSVLLDIREKMNSGDKLKVSYAFYGRGEHHRTR